MQKSALRLIVEPLAIAVVLALAVRSMIEIYSIPSDSMEPALQRGDHIVVTAYHFGAAPQRGEVVVFRSPRNPAEYVVKRIVAVPGDLVSTSSRGQLMIGGRIIAEPYLNRVMDSGTITPQVVPGHCYFVMGDNRGNSLDSRNWGVLPRSLIVGRARFVLWSSTGAGAATAALASTTPSAADAPPPHRVRFLLPIAER